MAFPPGEYSKLTSAQKDAVHQWLEKNWTQTKACPISGHSNWLVADHLVSPPVVSPPTNSLSAAAMVPPMGSLFTEYPQVMVVCRGCGYTIYFNAVAIGIIPPGGRGNANS